MGQEINDEMAAQISERSAMLDEEGKRLILDLIEYILKNQMEVH